MTGGNSHHDMAVNKLGNHSRNGTKVLKIIWCILFKLLNVGWHAYRQIR